MRISGIAAILCMVLAAGAAAKAARHASVTEPNTGLPGSACSAVRPDAAPPADSGPLDTTSLGPNAVAPYTIGAPTNAAERNQPVKRVMMLLHGGGWYTVGQGALNLTQGGADLWRDAGWEAINVDYLPCRRSLASALAMFDLVRAYSGPDVPVCISGDSSGAQLALMIASRRDNVSCVIANGPPTDLVRIARQGVHAAIAGTGPALLAQGALSAAGKALAAFGKDGLRPASPIRRAARINTRVLLATAGDDQMIPIAQVASMAHALLLARPENYVDTVVVGPGELPFAHGTASSDAVDEYYRHVKDLVAPFGDAPGQPAVAPPADPFKELISKLFHGRL
jgi:acetyl esterase/lipase